MYILGISGMGTDAIKGHLGTIGHDPSAAIIKDGKIIAAAEEERFVRFKHAPGFFPFNAVKFCLKTAGIEIDEVDYIVNNFNTSTDFKNAVVHKKLYTNPISIAKQFLWDGLIRQSYYNNIKRLGEQISKDLKDIISMKNKFHMVEHHLSHVGSSFLCSGFKKSNVLSIDCSGEVTSTLLGLATESKITKLKEVYNPNTLGLLYAMFTQFLGFEPDNGEYKVMGLASYGKPGVNMDGLIKVNRNGTFTIKDDIWGSVKHYSDYIINRFGQPKQKGTKYGEREANLAYGIQNLLEKTVLDLIKYMKRETGEDKLCLSGGVALNCKMNGRILASDLVSDLFVPPSPGDGGCAIGSALYFYHNLGYKVKEKMEHAYYGPEFTNDQILEDLKLYGIKDYEYIDDISGECGEIVSKGGIVGWFQGKMEWGPRALGNRSIVADPRNSKIKDKINESIKFREMFRPFCPSMLDKAKEEYLEKAKESPFMILAFQVPEEKRKEIEGVVHVDGSVRPQTVKKEINPRFYKLIESFEEHTSTPIVLNTSFNVRGDPIVCDPRDALRTFYTCGLTHLAIGNYLIKK